jgi:hypothetical protein
MQVQHIYIALYVDDIFLIGDSMNTIKEVKKQLSSKFDMKDIGATKFFLGMEIKRDRATRKIWLNKINCIETVLKHFNMHNCRPMKVPIPVGASIIVEQCPKE